MKIKLPGTHTFLRIASLLAILGLVLMCWGVVQPTPFPIIIGLSIGQGLGTVSFLIYLAVVLADLRRKKVFDGEPPP